MARTYLVDSKRYKYVNFVPTSGNTAYLLSEADNNKWIKIDTSNEDGDLQLPLDISEGFKCIIENTGIFRVNYINEAGTSTATQQDLFTEDQYRTVEVAFNQNEWRIQGYIGRNDISSLYDVNVTAAGLPQEGDVLSYNFNAGVWQAGKQPKFIPRSPENLDFIIQESDHGKIIPVNTTFAPVDVALNTGLPPGFYCRIQNVGTGTLTITRAVTWNSPINSINDRYAYVDIFHSGLEQYYVVSNEGLGGSVSSNGLDYFTDNFNGTLPVATGVDSLAIGEEAQALSEDSIAIGRASLANLTAKSIAIGAGATASNTNSIQLGTGINTTSLTLQYLTTTIANNNGIQAPLSSGFPIYGSLDGSLVIDTDNDHFYMRSNNAWVLVNSGGGEDYFAANFDGALPVASGVDALAIGENSQATNETSIAIGKNTNVTGSSSIVIGTSANCNSLNNIVIGSNSQSIGAQNTIVLGENSSVSGGPRAIAIGTGTTSNANRGISIGDLASNGAGFSNAMAIGTSTSSQSINAIAIGRTASVSTSSDSSIAIGDSANISTSSSTSIAIGNSAKINSGSGGSVAIGGNSFTPAVIGASVNQSFQLGAGTNNTPLTVQFLSEIIASNEGVRIASTSGTPSGSPLAGTAKFDSSSNTLYIYNGTAWVSTALT